MKMEVTPTLKRSVAIVLALAGVVALLLVAWVGSELRYGNCLKKQELAGKTGESCSQFP